MAEKNKENKFKEILSNSSFDLDQNEIWDNISERLPKKKDRKPFAWLFVGLLLGAVTLGSVLWLNGLFDIDNNVELTQSSIQNTPNEIQDHASELNQDSNSIALQSSQNENIKDGTVASNVGTIITNSNYELNTLENKIAVQPFVSNESQKDNLNQNSILPLRQKEENGLMQIENLISNTGQEAIDLELLEMGTNLKESFNVPKSILTKVDKIENLTYLGLSSSFGNKLVDRSLGTAILVKKPIKKWRSFLNLRSGANIALAEYSYDDAENIMLGESMAKESYSIGTQSDIRWNMEHRSGLAGLIGLSYRTDARVFKDESINSVVEQFPAEVDVVDGGGFVQTELVNLERTSIYYNDIQTHRLHKSYDLLLGISKQFLGNGAFGISGEALLKYNLYSSNKAYFFDNINGTIVSFAAEDEQPYRSQYGLSYQFALNLEFHKNHYSIGLSPYWTYRPSSMVLSTAGYVLKHNNMGLQLSLSFRPFN